MMRRVFFLIFAVALPVSIAHAATPDLPSAIIQQYITFAVSIAGFLAFVYIVYGGVKYIIAAGNPSGQSDARDQILQAIFGLLLLAGSALILRTISPAFDNLSIAPLTPLPAVNNTNNCPPGGCPACPASCTNANLGCRSDTDGKLTCISCPENIRAQCAEKHTICIPVGNNFTCKLGPCGAEFGTCSDPNQTCAQNPGGQSGYSCVKKP